MARLVCLLVLNLVLVLGAPVHENHDTSRLPAANVSSTLPAKEHVVQSGARNHGNQARNVLTQVNRTIRDVGCQTDDFYPADDLCCRNCPAGTRVAKHCMEDRTSGKCEACTDGEDYTEWENGMDECLPCTPCRKDQETVSQCTARRDSVCQCQAKSFCLPDQACEMCQKCTQFCPEGQTVKRECTPTSDTVCERTSSPAAPLSGGAIAVIVIVIVPFFVLLLILCLYLTHCCRPTGCKDQRHVILSTIKCLHRTDSGDSGSEVKKEVNESRSTAGGGGDATASAAIGKTDNEINEQAQSEKATLLQDSPDASARYRDEPSSQSPCHGGIGAGSSSELAGDPLMGQRGLADPSDHIICLNLNSPQNCGATDTAMKRAVGSSFAETVNVDQLFNEFSDEELRQSFQIFIKEVPIKSWKEFMRKLHLTENEIVEADRNNINNIAEGHYQMLHTWHQKAGRAARVQTLLTTLCDMDLRATVCKICCTLDNGETKEP